VNVVSVHVKHVGGAALDVVVVLHACGRGRSEGGGAGMRAWRVLGTSFMQAPMVSWMPAECLVRLSEPSNGRLSSSHLRESMPNVCSTAMRADE